MEPEKQASQLGILDDMPASCLDYEGNLQIAYPGDTFFAEELDLGRLHRVMHWLWLCGRTVPPRPLHQQLLLERRIVITESLDLHLTWGKDRMFLKPLPRWLIQRATWDQHLHNRTQPSAANQGSIRTTRSSALGFLLSYVALIRYENDFYIAKQNYLIPPELTWASWKILVCEILQRGSRLRSQVADRFIYGELRLSRLDLVHQFLGISPLGYLPRWNSYRRFVVDNLDVILSATVYMVVILTALQVGLSTDNLQDNKAFQAVAFGTTILAILGPLVAVAVVLISCIVDFGLNWAWNRRDEKLKEISMGRKWRNTQHHH